ncbi:MAG: reverse transcriptase-like protein, partial [Dermatophilaceae bacterium]|nr:reverse transcriptase-like protein [Dermatophilaceae bacterium]
DGGSRGNPGVAGYGALVRDTETGALLAERAEPLGKASNNVAEYRGLIAGLEAAHAIDPGAEVLARMDSKLVVEQMSGRWKIKHEDMRRLALQARDIAARITSAGGTVRYEWIPREINKDADALSNVAMDGRTVNRTFAESESAGQEPAGELDAAGDAAAAGGEADAGEAVRVVLVAAAASRDAAGATASAVLSVVGTGGIEVVGGVADAVDVTARAIGDALGTEVEVDPAWDSAGPGARAAWARAVARGGTVVAVCPVDVVRGVLADLLGVPGERQDRLAVAPGSLAGVEVWGERRVSVAFTNRT